MTITQEQFAAIQAFAAAFAPSPQDKKIFEAMEAPMQPGDGESTLTTEKLMRAKKVLAGNEPRIETPHVGKTKNQRKTTRAFWTDGTHAHLRRKKASPAMRERVDEKVRAGEYRHLQTSGDVEIYTIADWSPLRRRKLSLSECSPKKLEAYIVKAACKFDFKLYYDAISEYAYRLKNATDLPAVMAQQIYQQQMAYLERRILRRGGPSPIMIQAEVAKIRKERTGSKLYLPH